MLKSYSIKTFMAGIFCVLGAFYYAPNVSSATYKSGFDSNSWKSSLSVMRCRMVQKIPLFGEAVIQTRAGESSSLYFNSDLGRLKPGKAKLIAVSPVWNPDDVEVDLGEVSIKPSYRLLSLNSKTTEQLIKKLKNGLEVGVSQTLYKDGEQVNEARVVLNTVGFRREYRKYLRCLPGLLPRNFDQLKRTSLYFPEKSDQPEEELPAAVTRKLDHVLALVKHDTKVKVFYVDGHTDSTGVRVKNLEVSKTRAEKVAEYLTTRGVPKDAVKVRWHGERYPVASNGTDAGRAKNRRVTVRLERVVKIKNDDSSKTASAK